MSYNLNFSVFVPKEALTPELRRMFGLEPERGITITQLSKEDAALFLRREFTDYEEVL